MDKRTQTFVAHFMHYRDVMYILCLFRVELEPDDPRWVGAWWIGLLYSGLAAFTVSALMACFPRELPSMCLIIQIMVFAHQYKDRDLCFGTLLNGYVGLSQYSWM